MVVQLAEEASWRTPPSSSSCSIRTPRSFLGVHDLSLELERSLDALLGVIGGIEDERAFAGAMARLSASFERHVDGDEMGLLPMVEALGAPDQIVRMEQTIQEFERALATVGSDEPWFLPDAGSELLVRGGWKN